MDIFCGPLCSTKSTSLYFQVTYWFPVSNIIWLHLDLIHLVYYLFIAHYSLNELTFPIQFIFYDPFLQLIPSRHAQHLPSSSLPLLSVAFIRLCPWLNPTNSLPTYFASVPEQQNMADTCSGRSLFPPFSCFLPCVEAVITYLSCVYPLIHFALEEIWLYLLG